MEWIFVVLVVAILIAAVIRFGFKSKGVRSHSTSSSSSFFDGGFDSGDSGCDGGGGGGDGGGCS
ncbi:hypothetical protein [Melghirimyces algeriensis]|uniref:hypothetical protein n=1 Tax=Melghirimyces algeriensis TaxID=910412 RepID=UPI00163D940A|nr:hypothetical protein [Melghirimyces algeriensis]